MPPTLERYYACAFNEIVKVILLRIVFTNIFYILHKQFSVSERKGMLLDLCDFIDVVGIQKKQIINALNDNDFTDLEDRIQFECAQMINAHYIITRNIVDFTHSAILVILPEDFLKII